MSVTVLYLGALFSGHSVYYDELNDFDVKRFSTFRTILESKMARLTAWCCQLANYWHDTERLAVWSESILAIAAMVSRNVAKSQKDTKHRYKVTKKNGHKKRRNIVTCVHV